MKKLLINRITIPWSPFYRKHPYQGHASIHSVNDRNLVDFDLGIFCTRIPKAANSTIVTNLAYLKLGKQLRDRDAKKSFRSPVDLSQTEVSSLNRLYTFTIARNPYTRVLSAYLDKIERVAKKHRKMPSFQEFISYLEYNGLYKNAHWAPQTELMTLPASHYDLLGKTENLDETLKQLFHNVTPRYPLDTPITAKRNTMGASQRLSEYYTPNLADRIFSLYRDDFLIFEYPQDLPSKRAK